MPDPWSEFLHAVGGVVHEAELLVTGQKHIPLDLTVVGACLAAVGQDIARFGEHEVKVAHERFELVRSHVEGFHRAVQDASSTIGRIMEGASKEDTEKLPAELRDGIDDALQKLRSDSPEQAAARARDVRRADVKRSLDVVFKTTFDVFATHVHFLEVDIRAVLGVIHDALETVIILVGDLEEQHPVLFRAVVVFLAVQLGSLIVPPLVRVLLSTLGFGESGVVAGSTAAWIQSEFFGPAVPKGHIFGAMQAAGQTGAIPGLANLLGAAIGGLIVPKL